MQMRVRIVDMVAVVLWVAALGILTVATILEEGGNLARWALMAGMLATTATFWAIATWMVEVIRLEYEITTLRKIPRRRAVNGDE